MPLLPADATESAGLDRPLDSDARLLIDGVGRSIGVPTMRGDSVDRDDAAEVGRPLAPKRGVIWPGVAFVWLVSAECRLFRRVDDDEVEDTDRLVLPAELLEADDCVRPAFAAVVPEKVLGLSTPLLKDEEALADREPTRAAPALAGLCLGFIPAARPADTVGGRPFPSSVEDNAAEEGRVRSASFFASLPFFSLP